jgi:hypothetical protein
VKVSGPLCHRDVHARVTVVDGNGLNLSQYVVRVQKSPEYFVN